MKKHGLLIAVIAVLLVAAVLVINSAMTEKTPTTHKTGNSADGAAARHDHSTDGSSAKTIPAYLKVPPSRSSLAPTLEPEKFTGIQREAYKAVREIPVTIAQLPCYCHCDKGFGHKSLYSCFEDDHAAHCDVCIKEALLALKLEKEQKLTPAQIRETIVAQYAH